MARRQWFLGLIALGLLSTPAMGQLGLGNDGEKFVNAVRDRDGSEAMELLNARGPTVLNARDAKGETGLIVAISKRDDLWTSFLLQQGADPNLAARNGDTPLIAAARIGYTEAAAQLLRRKARIDAENRMGETALIIAVQLRNVPMVKLLLEAGANPDKPDSAAGYSARDYARRDTRTREILKLIEAKKPPPKA
jgi:ankyrin repeat protein